MPTRERNRERISLAIPTSLHEEIERIADADGLTYSEAVRKLLKLALTQGK